MKVPTQVSASIEGSAIRRRFVGVLAGALAGVAVLVAAPAQGGEVARELGGEVARELGEVVHGPAIPHIRWARDVTGTLFVQALVLSDSADSSLTDLRAFIVHAGGSVLRRHVATHALTVNVPASLVDELSRRSDVVSVTPNRNTHRTASTLETITGSLTSHVRTNSTKTSYSGLDGTGIGIAIVDSGVMKSHDAFLNGSGVTRVLRNVSMLHTTLANWTTGIDAISPIALLP